MAFRPSVPELSRPERGDRWDRDRFHLEHDRDRERDRDGYVDVRERFERDDDHVYARGGRDASERRYRRYDEDDVVIRERRTYEDESRRRPSPPPSEVDRRVFIQRERERVRSPSPPRRRPGAPIRRQSSLDTFDRRPIRHYDRDYSPPARGDYHVPPYVDIPLPRHKALPPPRRYAERDVYEEIHVSDQHRHRDDEFNLPERYHEKEIVRTRRRRSRSRSSRTTRRSSRSSSTSSSSSSGGTSLATRSQYPKKGKTRIPARLISKRALIEFGYPYVEEGNTIIVQKALGQQNIDDLLKLSDEYKKSELEILAARSSAGDIIEERRTEIIEVAPPPQQTVLVAAPPPPVPAVQFAETTHVVRDVSPARTYTTSTTSSYDTATSYDSVSTVTPVVVDAYHPHHAHHGGEIVLASHPSHRSRSRHSHQRHGSRDVVRAERLSTGELVLYEEQVERVEEPTRGLRIEKDRKGRMSISVPKHR